VPSSGEMEGLEEARRAFEENRFDYVLEWAGINWEAVGKRQKKLDQAQSRLHLLDKIKRDETKGKEQNQRTNPESSD